MLNKMSPKNKINKCRTCLKANSKLQLLNTKPKMAKVDKTYMELINHIAQIEFDTEDEHKMPQGVCALCSKKIRDSYLFIKQVRKCNTIFLKDTICMTSMDTAKLEETFATENVIFDECDEPSIKQEVNPFEDETMNSPKEEFVSDSSSSDEDDDNFEPLPPASGNDDDSDHTQEAPKKLAPTADIVDVPIKSESSELKNDSAELFPECVLNEDVFSDDESLSDKDSIKAEHDPTYDPLDQATKAKRKTKDMDDEDKNLPVPCDDCDRVFQNAGLLRRHKKDTHLPDELKVQCPHCPAKFSRRHNMYTHMRTLHKIEPVLEQKVQPGKVRKTVTCDHCQKSYCNKYKLMAHVKNKHGPDSKVPKPEKIKQPAKRFLCALCGFTCNSQPNLDVHYRRHTGERPFKCDHCDRRFYRMYDVQMHNLSHTGERPFKCTLCEKAFRRSSKLKIHMRTHTNERPYKCTECEKAFKQSKDLTVHRRIHTGERPYKCNVCESTFIQSNSLRLHQTKTKHFDATYPIPQTNTLNPNNLIHAHHMMRSHNAMNSNNAVNPTNNTLNSNNAPNSNTTPASDNIPNSNNISNANIEDNSNNQEAKFSDIIINKLL